MLQGHSRAITQVKYNREGDLIFSAAKDSSPVFGMHQMVRDLVHLMDTQVQFGVMMWIGKLVDLFQVVVI